MKDIPLLQKLQKEITIGNKLMMDSALWIAMISVVFQQSLDYFKFHDAPAFYSAIVMLIGVTLFWFQKDRKISIYIFSFGLLISFIFSWYSAANHTYLAVWALVPVIFSSNWWKDVVYTTYIRLTIAMVMIVAALQKVISGTFHDGLYISWLSNNGSSTERVFNFLCQPNEICYWYVLLAWAAILWQFIVGVFLLFGWKNWFVLFLEFSFLLFVGFYADEMNFQVLNIALLCMAFRFGMKYWMVLICISLLILDLFSISRIIDYLF